MITIPPTTLVSVNFGDLSMYANKSTSGQRKSKLMCISMLGGRCASKRCRWSNDTTIRPICVECALTHSPKEEMPGILGAPQRIQVGRPKRWVEMAQVLPVGSKLFPCWKCENQILISLDGQQAITSQRSVGCVDVRALQIDHVHGSGRQDHGRGNHHYSKVKSELCVGCKNWQLLCANCHWIKRFEKEEAQGYKQHRGR